MIYYTCSYIPMEVLLGTGVEFRRLLDSGTSGCHELGCNLCGYARTVYETGLELGEDDILLFADSCDAMRRVGDLLKDKSKASVFIMRLPWKKSEEAIHFLRLELERLIRFLEYRKVKIDIEKGIILFNELVDHVRLLEKNISGRELTRLYLDALNGLKHRPASALDGRERRRKRVGITGGIIDIGDIDQVVEGVGGTITYNDTCTGSRPFSSRTDESEDSLKAISRRLLSWRSPCGRFVDKGMDLPQELDGVLLAIPKFCDFYDFVEKDDDSRVYRMEVDYPLNSHGQLKTRMGALIEKNDLPGQPVDEGRDDMLLIGIDSGSTTTNAVLIDGTGRIVQWKTVRTGINASRTARSIYNGLLEKTGTGESDIALTVATGYGRNLVDFADETITEISCHAKGVARLFPLARGIVDIGGQDSKVIRLGAAENVEDFAMNDRCAAGTGRFLEVMARVLELQPDEMSSMALRSSKELPISSVCTVFAESEVVSLIGSGEKIEDICAGLFRAIVKRIASMYGRLGSPKPLVFTGGVARNQGVVRAMEQALNTSIIIPEIPDIMGAYGAAIFALEHLSGRKRG